jgi:hypothetical protein
LGSLDPLSRDAGVPRRRDAARLALDIRVIHHDPFQKVVVSELHELDVLFMAQASAC